MTTGGLKRNTTNYNLPVPTFDSTIWQAYYEQALDIIDAAVFAFTGVGVNSGVWDNATNYVINDRAVDDTDGTLWQCAVDHTSATTGTFDADRTANPTYWEQITSTVINGGSWATSTSYATNTFIEDGYRVGIVTRDYTSAATYDDDVTNGDIITLVDLTSMINDVQPILDNLANVLLVAASINNINLVGGSITAVNTCADNISAIQDAASLVSGVETIAVDEALHVEFLF